MRPLTLAKIFKRKEEREREKERKITMKYYIPTEKKSEVIRTKGVKKTLCFQDWLQKRPFQKESIDLFCTLTHSLLASAQISLHQKWSRRARATWIARVMVQSGMGD